MQIICNSLKTHNHASASSNKSQPAIERVQALADIPRSAMYAFAVYIRLQAYIRVCCHSNVCRITPIEIPPNSAQLEGIATLPFPEVISDFSLSATVLSLPLLLVSGTV